MRIINITAKHLTIDTKTRTYAEKKMQKLIDYIPRHARKSATTEMTIEKYDSKGANKIEAQILLNLPDKQLIAKEQRDGELAAIDGAEEKIKGQIRRYKIEQQKARQQGSIFAQIKRSLRRK